MSHKKTITTHVTTGIGSSDDLVATRALSLDAIQYWIARMPNEATARGGNDSDTQSARVAMPSMANQKDVRMPVIHNQVSEPFKVAHLYPPYQGKGLAAIVAHDGTKYKCEESQLAHFKEGEEVSIYFEEKSFKSKTGENVTFKKLVSKIEKPNGDAKPKQFTRARMDPLDSLEARKTAGWVAYIAAGKCPLNKDAIATALDEIDAGLRQHSNPAQVGEDMNDQVGF